MQTREHDANKLDRVCVGARIRFFKTADKTTGATNAARGTVTGFSPPDAHGTDITGVKVRLESGRNVSVNRMAPQAIARSRPTNEPYVSGSFWPIVPDYACTTHSVQGRSISGKVVIALGKCFVSGLAYTALSRNTNINDIYLAAPLTVADLHVVDIDAYYAANP